MTDFRRYGFIIVLLVSFYIIEKNNRNGFKKQNCWEYMKCGRESGGNKVAELGLCRAAADEFFNGINSGKNGGRICFAVAGTFPNVVVDGSFAKKLTSCKDCPFFSKPCESLKWFNLFKIYVIGTN